MITFTTTEEEGGVELEIYMGDDKYENERLIAHGWPEDVWMHVDDLSSAHVYLRLPRPSPYLRVYRETGRLDHMPKVLADCAQLVKANSIAGSKQARVDVVYTSWENLRKTQDMADGQVGFKDLKAVRTVKDVAKDGDALRRLNATRKEVVVHVDELAQRRVERDRAAIAQKKEAHRREEKEMQQLAQRRAAEAHARDYRRLFEGDKGGVDVRATTDATAATTFEDNFM